MDSLPSCALECLAGAVQNSSCTLSDFNCICQDTQLNAQVEPCILQSCTVKEALSAQRFSYTTCKYPTSNDVEIIHIVNIVGIIVAILSVSLRVAGRIVSSKMGSDDYTIVAALFTAVAIAGVGFPLSSHGLGRDIWMVSFANITKTLKLFFIEEILYVICVPMIKASMLLLYLRLFPCRTLRIAVLFTLTFTIAWTVASFFGELFSCSPIHYYWQRWDGEHKGRCVNHNALLLAHAITNITLDVVVIGLPLPTLLKLRVSLEKRIGLCLMFAVGFVVTVISIFRLIKGVGFDSSRNPTRDFVPVGILSLLEVDIGIMCSCMPGIRASCKYVWAAITKKQITTGSSTGRGSSGNRHPLKASQDPGGRIGQEDYPLKELCSSTRRYSLSGGRSGQFIRLKEIDPVYERQASRNDAVLVESAQEGLSWLSDGDS